MRCEDLKKVTTLWAAATFILLEMTIDASAAIILVPAAARVAIYTQGGGLLLHFMFK